LNRGPCCFRGARGQRVTYIEDHADHFGPLPRWSQRRCTRARAAGPGLLGPWRRGGKRGRRRCDAAASVVFAGTLPRKDPADSCRDQKRESQAPCRPCQAATVSQERCLSRRGFGNVPRGRRDVAKGALVAGTPPKSSRRGQCRETREIVQADLAQGVLLTGTVPDGTSSRDPRIAGTWPQGSFLGPCTATSPRRRLHRAGPCLPLTLALWVFLGACCPSDHVGALARCSSPGDCRHLARGGSAGAFVSRKS